MGERSVRVEPAVHELQQLDGELDVADPAPAALHLPVGEALAGQLGLGARLQVPQRPEVVGAEETAPRAGGRR